MNKHIHHNPETERYQQRIVEDRRTLRRSGTVAFIIGICLVPAGILILIWSLPQAMRDASTFQQVSLFVISLGTPLGLILLGLTQYLDGRQLVDHEEVKRKRQQERVQLFRIAQGKIPWRYSKVVLTFFAIFGILFFTLGIAAIVDTKGYNDGGLVWGILYSLTGLFFVLYAVIILPRRIKRLPAQSANALAASFIAGEATEGTQAQDNSEG